MTNLETGSDINGMACDLIEQVPGKVSGRPVVRGTRILPDPIVNSYDLGDSIAEIHEGFPTLSIAQIKRLIDFAHAQRRQHNVSGRETTKQWNLSFTYNAPFNVGVSRHPINEVARCPLQRALL